MTQDDREGLERLLEKTEKFTSEVFDWVSYLGRVDVLHMLYDLKDDIEQKLGKEQEIPL